MWCVLPVGVVVGRRFLYACLRADVRGHALLCKLHGSLRQARPVIVGWHKAGGMWTGVTRAVSSWAATRLDTSEAIFEDVVSAAPREPVHQYTRWH